MIYLFIYLLGTIWIDKTDVEFSGRIFNNKNNSNNDTNRSNVYFYLCFDGAYLLYLSKDIFVSDEGCMIYIQKWQADKVIIPDIWFFMKTWDKIQEYKICIWLN